jgi:hypothetical protein
MRQIDSNTLNALAGSRAGDQVVAYVWYAGSLAYPDPLPVTSWGFSWDITRQVQRFDCVVADPDGKLTPWLLEDPLGVGGSRLQVRWDVGAAGSVNMGWYRIAGSVPEERWHSYIITESGRVNPDSPIPPDKKLVMVTGGATISLSAYDFALIAKKDELLAPESPPAGATIVSEIKRLMRDIAPVSTAAGVVDRAVSPSLVYEKDRLDAVQDLCNRISCDYRMNGDGQMEVYPLAQQAPVAVLRGGPEGMLVKVDRAQDMEGLYNRFVVDGTRKVTGPDGSTLDIPVRGLAEITAGPLSVNGPHGRVPKAYSSRMITSQQDADDYALEMMQTQIAGLTVDLKVIALPLPHLQQGDWVQVGNPVVNGQEATLTGRVKAMDLRSNGTAPDRMTLTVQCSYADVQAVIGGIDRG